MDGYDNNAQTYVQLHGNKPCDAENGSENELRNGMGLTNEELLTMIRAGDLDAENELLSRYKKIVRSRTASYYMAGADKEDLIQEGMIGVFKAIRDYDESKGASFSTFAELCIQRQIITAIKGASRMKHSPLNNSLSLSKPVSEQDETGNTLEETLPNDRSTDPEAVLLLREDLEFIEQNAGEIFTNLERKVWKMYLQGCSYKEIAEKLDKTNKSVDNAIRRAKKKLSELLQK